MSLISAVTARGHMRFMTKEKGGVNAAGAAIAINALMIKTLEQFTVDPRSAPAYSSDEIAQVAINPRSSWPAFVISSASSS